MFLSFAVSSSEQGSGSGGGCVNHGLTLDWGHLEVVYESCVSATEGATVDSLLRLHTAISALINKNLKSVDRTQLLQVCSGYRTQLYR